MIPLEDRLLLVTAYWRTNLTLRQLAPLFGVSKSAAGRIVGHLGPRLALKPRRRFRKDTVLIVDGTLVPTRDHAAAERSKNYRYSTQGFGVVACCPIHANLPRLAVRRERGGCMRRDLDPR